MRGVAPVQAGNGAADAAGRVRHEKQVIMGGPKKTCDEQTRGKKRRSRFEPIEAFIKRKKVKRQFATNRQTREV